MERKSKNSFLLYTDYIKHISLLSDQEAGQLFKALFQFVDDGAIPNFSGSLAMCFSFISSQIQRDNEKYIDICEKRAEAGRKGGKQKKANLANANFVKQKKANLANANFVKQKKANLADNDTVPDNDTVTDTEIKYICSLLNQAKEKAGSKGRLKPKDASWFKDMYNIGVRYAEMKTAAERVAEIGKNVDWFSFAEMLTEGKAKGGM